MRTPKEFVAKFRKAVEKELRASLDDESGERCVEVGDEEYDFEWRGGCVEYMEEFEPSNEKEPALRATVRLRVQVVVEDVQVETF